MRRWLCLALISLAALAHAQLTQAEQRGLQDAMLIGGYAAKDLQHAPARPADPYALPFIDEVIAKPLDGIDSLLAFHQLAATNTAAGLLEIARHNVFGDTASPNSGNSIDMARLPKSIPVSLRDPVGRLIMDIETANASIRAALKGLSPTEKRLLIDSLPQMAAEDPSVKFGFVRQPEAKREVIFALLSKVDLQAIRLAGAQLTATVEQEIPALRAARSIRISKPIRTEVDGVSLEIGASGDDVHSVGNAMLCIDLSGRNRYTNRYAAGVGYASVLIDLGTAEFDVPDLGLGAGLLGVGIAYVGPEDETLQARALSFGAGLGGVGVFLKEGGSDVFRSTALSQGFGMFGIGLLVDNGTDKHYSASLYSQGAARTQGLGWMIDRGGRTWLDCGGAAGPGRSQGFSDGFGSTSGGLGLLTQLGPEATVVGGDLCQGSGREGGLGSFYSPRTSHLVATGASQGSADYSAGGFLFVSGNGSNVVGASGQATASHDSTAVILCRDDAFVSTGAARASSGGVSLFAGSSDGTNIAPSGGDGIALTIRFGTGGFALGDVRVRTQVAEGQVALEEAPIETSSMNFVVAKAAPPDTAERLVRKLDRLSRTERIQLAAIAPSALKLIFPAGLRGLSAAGAATTAMLCRQAPEDALKLLEASLSSTDASECRGAFLVACDWRPQGIGNLVAAGLKRESVQDLATDLAKDYRMPGSESDLMLLAGSQDPRVAAAALDGLANQEASPGLSTATVLLGSPYRAVRDAAIRFLAKMPKDAARAVRSLFERTEETSRRAGIRLLSALGDAASLDAIVPFLGDVNPGVKIEAMLALNGRFPAAARSKIFDLRRDPDARVRMVAEGIDPGR